MRDGKDEKKKVLTEAIANAKEAKKDVQQSKDGKEIATTAKWVTEDVQKALDSAIATAEASKAESEEDIKSEAEKLNNAVKVYVAAKKAGSKVGEVAVLDKKAIDTAIEAANNAKKDVKVSADGSDVVKAEKWVTNAEQKALTDAIAVAETAKGTVDSADKVTAAATALDNAVKTYTKAQKDGTKLDIKAIDAAIEAATKAKENIQESTDGSDVKTTAKWVTKEVQKALTDAITTATNAKGTVKSEKEVTAAAKALTDAIDTYTKAQTQGKQV